MGREIFFFPADRSRIDAKVTLAQDRGGAQERKIVQRETIDGGDYLGRSAIGFVFFPSRQERIDAIRCSFFPARATILSSFAPFPFRAREQRPIVLLLSKFDSNGFLFSDSPTRTNESKYKRFFLILHVYIYICCIIFLLIFICVYIGICNQIDTKHCIALPGVYCFVFHARYATGGGFKACQSVFHACEVSRVEFRRKGESVAT